MRSNRTRARGAVPSNSRLLRSGVLNTFAGGAVFTADRYTDSGAGKVSALTDWLDSTHTLAQGTDAARPSAPTSATAFRGAYAFRLSTGLYVESSRAASMWKYLNYPAGGTGLAVIWAPANIPAPTQNCYLVQTTNSTPRGGMILFASVQSGPTNKVANYYTTATTTVISATSAGSHYSAGAGCCLRTIYTEGASPETSVYANGTLAASTASSTIPPVDENPLNTLRVGGTTVGGGWAWDFHALFVTPPTGWTAAMVSSLDTYAKSLGLAGG